MPAQSDETTKESRLIARLSIINEQHKHGEITDERALWLVDLNLDEYNNGSPLEKLQRWIERSKIKRP